MEFVVIQQNNWSEATLLNKDIPSECFERWITSSLRLRSIHRDDALRHVFDFAALFPNLPASSPLAIQYISLATQGYY
jgi:hypothetical protein